MSNESNIEWCDRSWEVTAGCTKVSSGCANCYAERLVGTRFAGMARKRRDAGRDTGTGLDLSLKVINAPEGKPPRWNGHIELLEMNLGEPLSRRAPTVYFVNSRSDLFHEDVPFEYIDRVFAVMALCPRHRFLVLTKRPERMRAYLNDQGMARRDGRGEALIEFGGDQLEGHGWPLENVWLGTSVEDQETANTRLPELYRCPAAGRFISAEPLLDDVELPVRLAQVQRVAMLTYTDASRVSGSLWVIVGGESGPGARDFCTSWASSIVDQCRRASVPVFVKQLGPHPFGPFEHEENEGCGVQVKLKNRKGADMGEWPADLRVREVPEGLVVQKTPSDPPEADHLPSSARGGSGEEKEG